MNRWYTSDLHFGHTNIIKYENRPFDSVKEMNEGIVDRWNATVDPEDTVFIVGDLCMGILTETLPLVKRLNGTKVLRSGNHDRCWYFSQKDPTEWKDKYLKAGLAVVDPGILTIRADLKGERFLVDHFPYTTIERHTGRYDEYSPEDKGEWLIHGHVHSAWRQKGRQINVGFDPWGGNLVHEDEIVALRRAGPQDLEPWSWSGTF